MGINHDVGVNTSTEISTLVDILAASYSVRVRQHLHTLCKKECHAQMHAVGHGQGDADPARVDLVPPVLPQCYQVECRCHCDIGVMQVSMIKGLIFE